MASNHVFQQVKRRRRPCEKPLNAGPCEIEGHGRQLYLQGSIENLARCNAIWFLARSIHGLHEGAHGLPLKKRSPQHWMPFSSQHALFAHSNTSEGAERVQKDHFVSCTFRCSSHDFFPGKFMCRHAASSHVCSTNPWYLEVAVPMF
jgi:hypothetical protein